MPDPAPADRATRFLANLSLPHLHRLKGRVVREPTRLLAFYPRDWRFFKAVSKAASGLGRRAFKALGFMTKAPLAVLR